MGRTAPSARCAPVRAVVTGGTGFLGSRIVELLLARGDEVWSLGRRHAPGLESLGARVLIADIRDREAVRRVLVGSDVLFHAAAKVGQWGPKGDFHRTNLDGTRHVLAAARAAGTPRFIHTSSPSVVGYVKDIAGGGPDLPLAAHHETPYAETKAAAERLVMAENGASFRTVILRPHLVFGPGDPHLLPRFLDRARRGILRRVGDGRNRVDLTYIDNAAWAHLDAADAVCREVCTCAGRAYFIGNGEPVLFWEWLAHLLRELGLPPARGAISVRTARLLGRVLEGLWQVGRLPGEPPITRFVAEALARSHWYDMKPAQQDLGYWPRVSMDDATGRTIAWLRSRA